jgi:hypothetical protein
MPYAMQSCAPSVCAARPRLNEPISDARGPSRRPPHFVCLPGAARWPLFSPPACSQPRGSLPGWGRPFFLLDWPALEPQSTRRQDVGRQGLRRSAFIAFRAQSAPRFPDSTLPAGCPASSVQMPPFSPRKGLSAVLRSSAVLTVPRQQHQCTEYSHRILRGGCGAGGRGEGVAVRTWCAGARPGS